MLLNVEYVGKFMSKYLLFGFRYVYCLVYITVNIISQGGTERIIL